MEIVMRRIQYLYYFYDNQSLSFMSGNAVFGVLFIFLPLWFLPDSGNSQNLPPLSIIIHDSAATEGYFFLSPYTNGFVNTYQRSHQILDRYGRLVFYQIMSGLNLNPTIDFKLQPDGRMSYFDINREKWFFMDSTFAITDSIQCVNFQSDQHDIQVLPNGHYLVLGEEVRTMDLTGYHWFGFTHTQPGSANAQVYGVVVQEFDENKSLVWEWKGHDHYSFGDVDQRWLQSPVKVDWNHANAVEQDIDGNILISLRHFNEITKIDRTTGNIIWRLGGKMNEFNFTNDQLRFTGQHDIRRISDTEISIFDNGQYTNPPVSRGLVYSLDETAKTATLSWEYIYDSAMYSLACGNHQFISNGNHLVDFGFCTGSNPWMAVAKPDRSTVLEIFFPDKFISYRAFCYAELPWELNRPQVSCEKSGDTWYFVAEEGHPEYRWSNGATTAAIEITDTGEYWVFVPYGEGFLSSERIRVTDLSHPCVVTGEPAALTSGPSARCLPNPATETMVVCFDFPEKTHIESWLTDNLGRTVLHAFSGDYPAGSHAVRLDIKSLVPGPYILIIQTDAGVVTRKVIIQ